MEIVENLVKTTLGEIEKVLSTKVVVGEPLVIQDTTLVPLISVGFGFGAGGGQGKGESKQKGEGSGGGTGGGAWVRPVRSNSLSPWARGSPAAATCRRYSSRARLTTNSPVPPSSIGLQLRRVSFSEPSGLLAGQNIIVIGSGLVFAGVYLTEKG